MKIVVVPLGPGHEDCLTRGAEKALRVAKTLVLRTGRHGVAHALRAWGISFQTLDTLYEEQTDFDAFNRQAAALLLALAQEGELTYAVPDPACDQTVSALQDLCPQAGQLVVLGQAGSCAGNFRQVTAIDVEHAIIDVRIALRVVEIDNALLASSVKIKLLEHYPPSHEVMVFPPSEAYTRPHVRIELHALDRQAFDHTSVLFVPPAPFETLTRFDFHHAVDIVAALRAPSGCPWDREQTHESLLPNLVEEAYEVMDAALGEDMDRLYDELGDVLLQPIMHAQIAKEHGEFDVLDITTALARKMITRHSHVFGEKHAKNAQDALTNWEEEKKREKKLTTFTAALEDVPRTFPALLRAAKVQKKASRASFWADKDAKESIKTEVDLLLSATEQSQREQALGKVLLAVTLLCAQTDLLPETILQRAVDHFIADFAAREREEQI